MTERGESSGKGCLITGAASGLGLEFAILAAKDHFNLFLVDKDQARLEKAGLSLMQQYDVQVKLLCVDLSEPMAGSFLSQQVDMDAIDVLINNAGFGLYGIFPGTDPEKENRMVHLHILATMDLTKLFLKVMLERKSGRIMNVSSMSSFQPGPMTSVYSASKAFVRSFSMAVADEIRGSGVTLTVFCPGQTRTGFSKAVARQSGTQESRVPLFSSDASEVARVGYMAMMKGKTLVVPGFFNKFLVLLSRLIPEKHAAALFGSIQRRIRK